MKLAIDVIKDILEKALTQCNYEAQNIIVSPTNNPSFGDYQSNVAMNLAKDIKKNPRTIAEEISSKISQNDFFETVKIAGAGFINFTLSNSYVERLSHFLSTNNFKLEIVNRKKIVIDFSSPNIAKPMHVGHIRSTFIGDCLARVARFMGHDVHTVNHIGDWGTQFGMILYGWKKIIDEQKLSENAILELLRIYKEINFLCQNNENILDECRNELVKLQKKDQENYKIWQKCVDLSVSELNKIYKTLDINFDSFRGESFYNDFLQSTIDTLIEKNIAKKSDGAWCVFFSDKNLQDKPCIVQKKDGGFLYASTDISAIIYRTNELKADEIYYVVGAPQALHFQQIFAIAKILNIKTELVHVPFGSILGKDGKLMKTRSGESIGLNEVINESIVRAKSIIENKNPNFSEEKKDKIAKILGIGAIKYAELSQKPISDYTFDWDKMLSLQGNTAPYILNAYVRIQAIFRKLDTLSGLNKDFLNYDSEEFTLNAEAELALAKHIIQFNEILPNVLSLQKPNILADYCYKLAKKFHNFYESCPILNLAKDISNITPEQKHTILSRLYLAKISSQKLQNSLYLLGISTVEEM